MVLGSSQVLFYPQNTLFSEHKIAGTWGMNIYCEGKCNWGLACVELRVPGQFDICLYVLRGGGGQAKVKCPLKCPTSRRTDSRTVYCALHGNAKASEIKPRIII